MIMSWSQSIAKKKKRRINNMTAKYLDKKRVAIIENRPEHWLCQIRV